MPNEFAPGLPSKERFDPITGQTGKTRLVVQRHKASSDHYDFRLQEGDIAHSWVSRSLPGEKDKVLLIRQPTHTVEYMEFEGAIPKGTYGAGTVKKAYDKPVEVLESSNSRIKLVLPEGEFTMIKMKQEDGKQENWLMVKNKNTIPNPVTDKPKLKDISKKELNFDDPTKMWQPKVDGGHTIFRLHSNTPNRVYSYRTSSKTSLPIEHTHQTPDIRDAEVPQDLHGVEIRGDLYAKEHDGKPMGAQDVGGMLNANIMNSREEQGARGKLIPYIYDVIKGKNGEDLRNAPYAKKYDLIKEIEKKIPIFRAADAAITKAQKQEMFNQIQQKKHPDTVEGIVEWDLTAPGGDPKKYKIRDTHEVIIRDIFPAVSPKPVPFAGGFGYSWEPEGPVVGRVGTGFSQKMREEMVANPKKYIGRVARIKTQQVFPSGAARAPSYYSMHVEKNLEKAASAILEKISGPYDKLFPEAATKPLRVREFKQFPGTSFVSGRNTNKFMTSQALKQGGPKFLISLLPTEGKKEIIRRIHAKEGQRGTFGTIRKKEGKIHSYINYEELKNRPKMLRETVMHEKFHKIPVIGKSEILAHLYGGAFNRTPYSMLRAVDMLTGSRPRRVLGEMGIGLGTIAAGKAITKKILKPSVAERAIELLKSKSAKIGAGALVLSGLAYGGKKLLNKE